MDYDPHPDLPEFMRVPISFSAHGLIAYLNDRASHFDVSSAEVRILMSQTQLYSTEELINLMTALSTDALFQITENLALNTTYWLHYPPVEELLCQLDRAVVFRFDLVMNESGLMGTELELLTKSLVCVLYRRGIQNDEPWLHSLLGKVDVAKGKKVPLLLICSHLPVLIKDYFEEVLAASVPAEIDEERVEPPIAHPLLGAVRADEDIAGVSVDQVDRLHVHLKKLMELEQSAAFMTVWTELNDKIVSGDVSDVALDRYLENIQLTDIATLLKRLCNVWESGASFVSGIVMLNELYETLISRLIRMDASASTRGEVVSNLVLLIRFVCEACVDGWDVEGTKADIKRLRSRSIIDEADYLMLDNLIK